MQKLRQYYSTTPWPELMAMFGKSAAAIAQKAQAIGLQRCTVKSQWNADEVKLMCNRYSESSTREIAELTGRAITAVLKKAQALGLKKTSHLQSGCRRWEKTEDEFLKAALSTTTTITEIASQLSRSEAAVRMRVFQTGLSGLRNQSGGNAKPIGAERISSHTGIPERKVANTGDRKLDWKRIDVLEWEAINGPVPEGMVLIKQPGQPRTVDNLQLVSPSDVPVMAVRHDAPPEIRRLLSIKSQLGFALMRIEKLNPEAAQSKGCGRHLKWSEADEEYLRKHDSDQSPDEIACSLGRSRRAVIEKRKSMGLAKKIRGWNHDEKSRLVAAYQTTSLSELAVLLGRSEIAVQRKSQRMGLRSIEGDEKCRA